MNGREGTGGGGPGGQLKPSMGNRNAPRTTTAAAVGVPMALFLLWAFRVGVRVTGLVFNVEIEIEVPEGVAVAFGSVCSFVLALLTKER